MSLVMGIVVAEPCSYEHRAFRILIMTIYVDKCLILLPDKAVKCVPSRTDRLFDVDSTETFDSFIGRCVQSTKWVGTIFLYFVSILHGIDVFELTPRPYVQMSTRVAMSKSWNLFGIRQTNKSSSIHKTNTASFNENRFAHGLFRR